ncbi:MAG: hypothetical protein M1826_006026 [Phylliscum demangeonii]|nr:MAG: hypothetical protein M1826_006026 [Phylliscum demangeonii]
MSSAPRSEPWSVESVISSLPPPHPQTGTPSPVPFFHLLERLKTTKREGWRRFGIRYGESIADHMYRMSILTMLAPAGLAARLDVARCTKMALVHDMAEALVGDITPVDGVAKGEKSRREAAAMDYLTRSLLGHVGDGDEGRGLREIWHEYEAGETLEAQFVHDVDKLELVLQMMEYERRHHGHLDLGEFSWVARRIVLPEVRLWCDEVLLERARFWREIEAGQRAGAGAAAAAAAVVGDVVASPVPTAVADDTATGAREPTMAEYHGAHPAR